MAKKSKVIRKTKKGRTADLDDEFASEDELEENEEELTEQKARKRSQAAEKLRVSHKKHDKIVVAVAVIIILATLVGYYYMEYGIGGTSEDGNGSTEPKVGNYSATLEVISHVTHTYADNSWHIINIGGFTNFLLKVENTGTLEDTYKLSINNLDNKININFNKNNFKINPQKSILVIVNVTTSYKQEYRLPTPIEINLVSGYTKSTLDSVQIDITVEDLDEEEVVVNGDKLQAYYTGSFGNNGSLFDYSFKDPENKDPLYVSLTNDVQTDKFESIQYVPVITGFKKGIIGMLPGETHVIVVPPELGYPSDHDLGGKTLIFEVKIISNDRDA